MKYLINFKEYVILNEGFSKNIKDKLIIKYKNEDSNLTDSQILFYIDEFDKYKSSPKIVEKDIFKYSFIELEKLIDSFPKKVNKSLTGLNNLDSNDIVYEENNLLILKGDTKEKCIRYGKGYSWCVSRTDASNMFNTYRYRYDEINFYFIFDKDITDNNRSLVLLVDKNCKYYLANASNSGDFAGTKEFNFEQICSFQPKLKDLKELFKPLPLTLKEKEIFNKIKQILSCDNLLEFLGSYEIVEAYISFGHKLNDEQYNNLTDSLRAKYINLSHILTDTQLSMTSNKLKDRYNDLHCLQYWLDNKYSNEEQAQLTILNVSYQQLTSLKGIENLTNLNTLIIICNYLTTLKGIENLTSLESLDCSLNHLNSLKDIKNLTSLKELVCDTNPITSLKDIGNLTNLTELSCRNNKLTSLDGIQKLNMLKILKYSGNYLPSKFLNKENMILRRIRNGKSID